MKTFTQSSLKSLFVLIGLVATILGPGCFQQDNNAEFKRTAPAPPPPENPDMSYAEHKAAKRRVSDKEKKVEAREKAAAEKAAAASKAP